MPLDPSQRIRRVVVVPGEDAAPEAMLPTLRLLDHMDLPLEWIHPAVGADAERRYGSPFPAEARAQIDAADATLFGSASGKAAVALAYLRWGKETYANVRPARWWPGCRSPLARPEGVDFIVVRENLEDLYLGCEGDVVDLAPLGLHSTTARRAVHEMAPGRYALKVITEAGSERIVRFAFELARLRREEGYPGRVTCATKHNMLPQTDGLFRATALRLADEYPDVELRTYIVDDFARRMVAEPHALDVVVLPNLYGDVLSDLAAGLIGGLGLAPSGCYGEHYAYFESAHGSAPDIAGRDIINPTATILSAAMMLEYLDLPEAASRLVRAVETVYAEGKALTPDQGGSGTTSGFCEAVAARL